MARHDAFRLALAGGSPDRESVSRSEPAPGGSPAPPGRASGRRVNLIQGRQNAGFREQETRLARVASRCRFASGVGADVCRHAERQDRSLFR